MAIIGFSEGQEIEFIPSYDGNRDNEDPCVVTLKYVPYGKVLDYSRLLASRTRGVKDQDKAAEAVHGIQKKQFCDNVAGVSGYIVNGQAVTTAAELWEVAPAELIDELLKAMESTARLNEGQRKN